MLKTGKNEKSRVQGALMRALRSKRGFSLENVAADLSVPKTTLFQMEKGTRVVDETLFERFMERYEISFDGDWSRLEEAKRQIEQARDAIYTRNREGVNEIQTGNQTIDYGYFHRRLLDFALDVPFYEKDKKAWRERFEAIEQDYDVLEERELALFYTVAGYDQIWNTDGREARRLLETGLRLACQCGDRKVEALALLWLGQWAIGTCHPLEGLRLTQKAKALFLEQNQWNRAADATMQSVCFLCSMRAYEEAKRQLDQLEKTEGVSWREVVNQRIWIAFQQKEFAQGCALIEENRTKETLLDGNFGLLPMGYFLLGETRRAQEELSMLLPIASDPWTKAGLTLVEDLLRSRRKNIHRTLKTLRHQSEARRKRDVYRFLLGCVIETRTRTLDDKDVESLRELVEWQREWMELE
ncbi:helix-turn-helix domain-containing protein [uncultured Dubosiella sp.]|uniref:helix-turn-helix domain-containing protein n=2 Tax=uncultured Dubosiella sp. TaxID=1937011 RepID=UPI00259934A6|nr:helix-turn-helix transcriptional regulator [uncultured Dubosiella sp.]